MSFQSLHGYPEDAHHPSKDADDKIRQIARWSDEPKDPANYIGEQPMPVFINLWLFQGHPPTDARPVEVIVSSFKFTPK